jgi:hypothetical protein
MTAVDIRRVSDSESRHRPMQDEKSQQLHRKLELTTQTSVCETGTRLCESGTVVAMSSDGYNFCFEARERQPR